MNATRQEMKTWIRALRSGKYRQAKGTLQNDSGHCCLGVACEVFVPTNKQARLKNGALHGPTPVAQRAAPEWLKIINIEFEEASGRRLSQLNDYDELTFNEIADLLQAVYIHEVLK